MDEARTIPALGRILRTACIRLSDRDLRTFLLARAERMIHTDGSLVTNDCVEETKGLLHDLMGGPPRSRRASRPRGTGLHVIT